MIYFISSAQAASIAKNEPPPLSNTILLNIEKFSTLITNYNVP